MTSNQTLPRIEIINLAKCTNWEDSRPAVFKIGGVICSSDMPDGAGEADCLNRDLEALQAATR